MARLRKKIEAENNQERWLLTYADLITLLLAFFIVMYAISQIDSKKFSKMSEALNGVLKGESSIIDKGDAESVKNLGIIKLGNLNIIQKQLAKKFEILGKNEEVQTEITERGLVVHIMESALFEEGSADLMNRTTDILDIIYEGIKGRPNHVRIEGHTDDRTIQSVVYPSNWELSTARATSVVRYFIENYDITADKLSALGYSEYRPIKPNNSIENRAINRRVDIVILTMDLTLKEPSSQLYEFVDNR